MGQKHIMRFPIRRYSSIFVPVATPSKFVENVSEALHPLQRPRHLWTNTNQNEVWQSCICKKKRPWWQAPKNASVSNSFWSKWLSGDWMDVCVWRVCLLATFGHHAASFGWIPVLRNCHKWWAAENGIQVHQKSARLRSTHLNPISFSPSCVEPHSWSSHRTTVDDEQRVSISAW